MQINLNETVTLLDSVNHFSNLLKSDNLPDAEKLIETKTTLQELVEFRNSLKYCIFKALSDKESHHDYLTNDEKVNGKLDKKRKDWNEYNSELSDLLRIFINAQLYSQRFNALRKELGIETFKDNSTATQSTLYFLDIVAVSDFMLYKLVTNPKMYFESILFQKL